jgi:hypothetical protein
MALAGMLEVADEDTALGWHLFSNHYPPLPRGVLALAKKALKAYREGETERLINTEGVAVHRQYGTSVPASACVRAWHLEAFLGEDTE